MILTDEPQTDSLSESPVLELSDVSFTGQSEYSIRLSQVNLTIRQQELLVIHLQRSRDPRELASMLQGLLPTTGGSVLFQNQDWQGNDFDRHFRMRSQIGRVFTGQAWIENLNVAENVTLARRHHQIDVEQIDQDVKYWVNHLGLVGLSRKRPAFVEPSLLQLHQWVRAFLLRPALLILERPMESLPLERIDSLIDAIKIQQDRGTAVLWFSSLDDRKMFRATTRCRHFRLDDRQLLQFEGDSKYE